MGIHGWSESGFGIRTCDLEDADIKRRVSFIKKFLSEDYEKMKADAKSDKCDIDNNDEFLNYCDEWINRYHGYESEIGYEYSGFGGLFAQAIRKNEEGFDVYFFENEEEESIVIYEDKQPWEMSERVLNMKEEDMAEIFYKYSGYLNIKIDVEKQELEHIIG